MVFFFVGVIIIVAFSIQIWIDYSYGQIWRAILMELLALNGALICVMEADTQFIRANIQSRLYAYYQFLAGIKGRTVYYAFIAFLSFGSFTRYDSLAIFGGMLLLLLTLIRFLLYLYSDRRLANMVFPMIDSSYARERFREVDIDADGYLQLTDIDSLVGGTKIMDRWFKEVIFWRIDAATNDGQIDVHEFVQFCVRFKESIATQERIEKQRQNL